MALGQVRIPISKWQYFVVTGGPFVNCPPSMVGVKMAKEIRRACVVDIPTDDYSTPDPLVLERGLGKAVEYLLAGKPVYVGCMGGKGRTGLFLAVLAKAFGIKDPVEYIRANYYAHAVETTEQYDFVTDFPISLAIRRRIRLARWMKRLMFWKTNLTRLPSSKDLSAPREVVRGSVDRPH